MSRRVRENKEMEKEKEKEKEGVPESASNSPQSNINIYLFYANIMDYFRVVLSMFSFYIAKTQPILFVISYFISFILDAFDGMVARAYDQESKLGATLDMVTDRISTAGLLCVLSGFYREWSTAFVYLIMLDVGSHWLQTHSGLIVDPNSVNHKNLGENFLVLRLYYTNRNCLGIVCLGAELYLLLLYLNYFYKFDNVCFTALLYLNFVIYCYKQFVSILQIFGAGARIGGFDEKHAIEKANKKKSS